MPRPGGNPNLKGNKNSGRYSLADEALKNRVKHKAWTMKELKMSDGDATQIVLRDMVDKKDVSVTLPEPLLGGKSNVSNNTINQQITSTEEKD